MAQTLCEVCEREAEEAKHPETTDVTVTLTVSIPWHDSAWNDESLPHLEPNNEEERLLYQQEVARLYLSSKLRAKHTVH